MLVMAVRVWKGNLPVNPVPPHCAYFSADPPVAGAEVGVAMTVTALVEERTRVTRVVLTTTGALVTTGLAEVTAGLAEVTTGLADVATTTAVEVTTGLADVATTTALEVTTGATEEATGAAAPLAPSQTLGPGIV